MGKTTKLQCDCGCGATATNRDQAGWLVLSQINPGEAADRDPKLDRDLFYKDLNCLKKWVQRALGAVPRMQKMAEGLAPRGQIVNKEVRGLYI